MDWRYRKFTHVLTIVFSIEEYEKLDACPVCDAKRYKIRQNDPGEVDGEPVKKKFPLR